MTTTITKEDTHLRVSNNHELKSSCVSGEGFGIQALDKPTYTAIYLEVYR